MAKTEEPTARYLLLDILRGLAALAVVVFHWQHFFYSPTTHVIDLPDRSVQPMYNFLYPIYGYGHMAVELFFSLSGFIFFCLYEATITQGRLSAKKFAVLRMSRLYPLHIAVLIMLVGLQGLYWLRTGTSFVFQNNDLQHFILQSAFVQNWYPGSDFSFNGPEWSVSIEVMLYTIFFCLCQRRLTKTPVLVALCVIGLALRPWAGCEFLGRGIFSFFAGALCFRSYKFLKQTSPSLRAKLKYSAAAALAGVLLLYFVRKMFAPLAQLITASAQTTIGTMTAKGIFEYYFLAGVLFPGLIVLLALVEPNFKGVAKKFAWIGDITYSSYLLHFPLQLTFVLSSLYFAVRLDPRSNVMFFGFASTLLVVSFLTFHYFEKPMQRLIRQRFGDKKRQLVQVPGEVEAELSLAGR